MRKSVKKQNTEIITMLNGTMTYGIVNDNQHIMDFMCDEHVEMEPFIANCKVQAMRDGNVYITQKPPRIHSNPLFREDNSSLTLGRDRKYCFVFLLPEELEAELPDRLVHQALSIAQKMERLIASRVGKKDSKK